MKNLFKSLAKFQQECPIIQKDTQGYGYKYTDLPAIFNTINPILKSNGLGFYQAVSNDSLKTTIFHIESGEAIEESANIPQGVVLKGMNDFQVLGSAITYMRRYQLSAMLGIVTDKDIDAYGEQEKKTPVEKKPPVKPSMNEKQFAKALKQFKEGDTSIDEMEKYFTITPDQRKQLV